MVVPPQPPPQPLLPSMDARQLAAQQQSFINQQALLLVRVGRAPRLPGRARPVGRARPALTWSPAPPPQAQQMTAQAMSLSLEQQTRQRQRQAQATSAMAPKPKTPPAAGEEPEPEPEPVGVCLREEWRRQRAIPDRAAGSRAAGMKDRAGSRKMQKRCRGAPVPGIRGVHRERGKLAGRAVTSLPLPARRPRKRPRKRPPRRPCRTRRRGTGASSRNGTISRRWVRGLGVAGPRRSSAPAPAWPGDSGCPLSPESDVACPGAWMGRPGGG